MAGSKQRIRNVEKQQVGVTPDRDYLAKKKKVPQPTGMLESMRNTLREANKPRTSQISKRSRVE
jgi:hypothetical protein